MDKIDNCKLGTSGFIDTTFTFQRKICRNQSYDGNSAETAQFLTIGPLFSSWKRLPVLKWIDAYGTKTNK